MTMAASSLDFGLVNAVLVRVSKTFYDLVTQPILHVTR